MLGGGATLYAEGSGSGVGGLTLRDARLESEAGRWSAGRIRATWEPDHGLILEVEGVTATAPLHSRSPATAPATQAAREDAERAARHGQAVRRHVRLAHVHGRGGLARASSPHAALGDLASWRDDGTSRSSWTRRAPWSFTTEDGSWTPTRSA